MVVQAAAALKLLGHPIPRLQDCKRAAAQINAITGSSFLTFLPIIVRKLSGEKF
jgi:hypothetical protein